ncbi:MULTISPECIES: helix-turn-helix transcriptional regulator [Ferrimonas]|uniref:helix-turn-helix transcriptional regulator n=1 Tax=Ferrimonas TaxID=44011 RepID=UPI0012EC3618|nr:MULTISPECIES: helix-turn-helix transcriptional regulator [Ferrimonas]USD39086.1 helix-turn-helix transcriptional regulator [Ferrimonas sp. SCSIO 43195]
MPAQHSEYVTSQVIKAFLKKLKPLGFERFYYSILPDDLHSFSESIGRNSKLFFGNPSSLKKMRYTIASDDGILQFREEYLYRFSRGDCSFLYSRPSARLYRDSFHFPGGGYDGRRQKIAEQLRVKYSFGSAATYYHSVTGREDWMGIFHLFSDQRRAVVQQNVMNKHEELVDLLLEFSSLFCCLAHQDINPIANFGLLSPNCIKILTMVAEGDSSEEIGKKLFLTERGVNYHLDRAREILGARNRTNLVSKAYQTGLL